MGLGWHSPFSFQISVRMVIAFIFAGVGAGVLGYLAVHGNRDALVALVAIVSSVTSYYFVQAQNKELREQVKCLKEELESIKRLKEENKGEQPQ